MKIRTLFAAPLKNGVARKIQNSANRQLFKTLSGTTNAKPLPNKSDTDQKKLPLLGKTSFPRSVQMLFAYDDIMKNRQSDLKLIRNEQNVTMNLSQIFTKASKHLATAEKKIFPEIEEGKEVRSIRREGYYIENARESSSSSRKRLNLAVSSRVMSTTTSSSNKPNQPTGQPPCKSLQHCALLNGNVCEATPQGMKATPEQEALHFKQRLATVTGLSERVLKLSKEPVGPGALKGKKSKYKNPEFFSYHPLSFYEAEVELSCYRLPQPSNKTKLDCKDACP